MSLLRYSKILSYPTLNPASKTIVNRRCLAAASNVLKGTKENPNIVVSRTDKCIVGCRCKETDPTLNWFFIESGEAQVCNCGHYFKLEVIGKEHSLPEFSEYLSVRPKERKPRTSTWSRLKDFAMRKDNVTNS